MVREEKRKKFLLSQKSETEVFDEEFSFKDISNLFVNSAAPNYLVKNIGKLVYIEAKTKEEDEEDEDDEEEEVAVQIGYVRCWKINTHLMLNEGESVFDVLDDKSDLLSRVGKVLKHLEDGACVCREKNMEGFIK